MGAHEKHEVILPSLKLRLLLFVYPIILHNLGLEYYRQLIAAGNECVVYG